MTEKEEIYDDAYRLAFSFKILLDAHIIKLDDILYPELYQAYINREDDPYRDEED